MSSVKRSLQGLDDEEAGPSPLESTRDPLPHHTPKRLCVRPDSSLQDPLLARGDAPAHSHRPKELPTAARDCLSEEELTPDLHQHVPKTKARGSIASEGASETLRHH